MYIYIYIYIYTYKYVGERDLDNVCGRSVLKLVLKCGACFFLCDNSRRS